MKCSCPVNPRAAVSRKKHRNVTAYLRWSKEDAKPQAMEGTCHDDSSFLRGADAAVAAGRSRRYAAQGRAEDAGRAAARRRGFLSARRRGDCPLSFRLD